MVFGWGINDSRLCQEVDELEDGQDADREDRQEQDSHESKYLSATMLHQLNGLRITRIACTIITKRGTNVGPQNRSSPR